MWFQYHRLDLKPKHRNSLVELTSLLLLSNACDFNKFLFFRWSWLVLYSPRISNRLLIVSPRRTSCSRSNTKPTCVISQSELLPTETTFTTTSSPTTHSQVLFSAMRLTPL